MGSYYIELTFELGAPDDALGLEAHLDEVAAAFAAIETVDGDVGADLETGRVDLCMTVPSGSRVDALSTAVSQLEPQFVPLGVALLAGMTF